MLEKVTPEACVLLPTLKLNPTVDKKWGPFPFEELQKIPAERFRLLSGQSETLSYRWKSASGSHVPRLETVASEVDPSVAGALTARMGWIR